MHQLIKAQEKHLDQIVPLLVTTGYWDAGLKDNSLNLMPRDFMKEYIAKPYLPYTTVAVEEGDSNKVLGVIVCGSKKEIFSIPDHSPYMNPRIASYFSNFFTFEMPNCYHISFLAVAKSHRRQGLGKALMEFAEKNAKEKGLETLSLFTFSCLTSSMKLYLDIGMMVTKVITLSNALPFPIALYFEKSIKLLTACDYFETEAYKHLNL